MAELDELPSQPTASPGRQKMGFGAQIPGMRTAPVEHVVRSRTRAEMAKTPEAWKDYNELSRTMRIVNRAAKGPCKGKPFCAVFGGEVWPEGAAGDDHTTWLQPGEYMDVPKDIALYICGNVWDPKLPNKQDLINRYGDFQYKGIDFGAGSGRMVPMVKVGPPPLPDLVVCELDGRSREKSNWKSIYDIYMKHEAFGIDVSVSSEELASAPTEPFEKVLTPA